MTTVFYRQPSLRHRCLTVYFAFTFLIEKPRIHQKAMEKKKKKLRSASVMILKRDTPVQMFVLVLMRSLVRLSFSCELFYVSYNSTVKTLSMYVLKL